MAHIYIAEGSIPSVATNTVKMTKLEKIKKALSLGLKVVESTDVMGETVITGIEKAGNGFFYYVGTYAGGGTGGNSYLDRCTIEGVPVDEYELPSILSRLVGNIDQEQQHKTTRLMSIAAKIADALNDEDISVEEFADLMNQNSSDIGRWLSGTYNFSVDTLIDIEYALGIKLLNTYLKEDKELSFTEEEIRAANPGWVDASSTKFINVLLKNLKINKKQK